MRERAFCMGAERASERAAQPKGTHLQQTKDQFSPFHSQLLITSKSSTGPAAVSPLKCAVTLTSEWRDHTFQIAATVIKNSYVSIFFFFLNSLMKRTERNAQGGFGLAHGCRVGFHLKVWIIVPVI